MVWYSHKTEYSAIKRNEIPRHLNEPWKHHGNERCQSQKTIHCIILFTWTSRIHKSRDRGLINCCLAVGGMGGLWGLLLKGTISFGGDENVQIDCDDGYTTLWNTKNCWNV